MYITNICESKAVRAVKLWSRALLNLMILWATLEYCQAPLSLQKHMRKLVERVEFSRLNRLIFS